MPGNIGTCFVNYEIREFLQFLIGIVFIGYQQSREFHPYIRFFGDIGNCIEHRLQSSLAQARVEIFTECLQVDVYAVKPIGGKINRFGRHKSIAHKNVRKSILFCQPAAIIAQLHENGRLCVCISNALAAAPLCCSDDLFSCYCLPVNFPAICDHLADLPVLAEFALKIAAHSGY